MPTGHCRSTPLIKKDLPATCGDYQIFGAGGGSRTLVSALGRLHNSRYTTPARFNLRIIPTLPLIYEAFYDMMDTDSPS